MNCKTITKTLKLRTGSFSAWLSVLFVSLLFSTGSFAQLVPFNLTAPADGATITVEGAPNTEYTITWEASSAGATYQWQAILPDGFFTNPALAFPSNSGGTATALTLTAGALDGVLATNGVAVGGSLSLAWDVLASLGGDSEYSENGSFDITLVRGVVEEPCNPVTNPFAADFNIAADGLSGLNTNFTRVAIGTAVTGVAGTPAVSGAVNATNTTRFLETPVVANVQAGDEFSFFFRWMVNISNNGYIPVLGDSIVVSIIPDCGNGTPVKKFKLDDTNHTPSNLMAPVVIGLEDFIGDDVKARIDIYRAAGTWNLIIDNIALGDQVCWPVRNLQASVLTNSATLTWLQDFNATEFDVLFGEVDFDPETEGTLLTATENTITLSGLDELTTYDAYVRTSCPDISASSWTKVTFTTLAGTDVALTSLITPTQRLCYTDAEVVTVRVTNTGGNALDFEAANLTVTAALSGASTETLTASVSTGTLEPSATLDIVLGNLDMSTPGVYTFNLSAALAGDQNPANNQLEVVRQFQLQTTIPYEEDFNDWGTGNTFAQNNWQLLTGAFSTWALSPADWGFDGSIAIRANAASGSFGAIRTQSTPTFMPEGPLTLTFKHKVTAAGGDTNTPYTMQPGDRIEIFVLDVCTNVETIIYTINSSNHDGTSNAWFDNITGIVGFEGNTIRIGFRTVWGANSWWG
ncbi:MAG: hypothetical protein ACXITV_01210, partial [Luteibaculaceae bacterium]